MSRTVCFRQNHKTAGFTLIEVLVALAVLGVSLMSIGALVSSNLHGTRALEEHVALLSVARAVAAGLPDNLLDGGTLNGNLDGHPWHVAVAPFTAVASRSQSKPQAVAITVSSPTGARFRLDTVRLRRSAEP